MTQSFSIPGAGQRAILAVLVAASLVSCNQGDQLPGAPSGPAHSSAATGIGIVSDLRVTATTDSSVTLTFTEVTDGTGLPAGYDVRFATAPLSWGSAAEATRGSCASPLAGIRIGAARSCTVLGLAAATTYQFQVVGFRGILDLSAVFGDLSNVAAGTTPGTTGGGAGGTVLLQEGFEDGSLASRGWYDNTALSVTAAQHHDGSSALEAHFLAGATTPTWGGAARHLFTPSNSVYLSYWVKYSSNWVGSGATYHPHEFLFLTTEDGAYVGPSSTHLTTYVEHNYQNGGIPVLDMQDGSNIDQSKIGVDLTRTTENRAANGCNGTLDGMGSCYLGPAGIYQNEKRMEASAPTFLPNPGTGYKGDWHFVEAYFQLNSIQSGKGVADGIAQYWFDGQLVINQTHLLMRTGVHATMQFNQFMIAPYIGDGSPVDQTMWVDDVTLATARVGSAPPPPTVATVTV
ncbi:MAG: fibronectin type III domain-containing protein, partial [Gemmatimonadales bacterium]